MGIFKKKSAAEKARDEAKKKARREARADKKDARTDARDEKRKVRRDTRDEKRDARETKRDTVRDIRRSDLKGKDKRDAKKDARRTKRDTTKLASQDKRDAKKDIRVEKKQSLTAIREEKRATLKSLRVPKASTRRWNSYMRFQNVNALEIYLPKTLGHLQTICRIATENELKVRAIGSGHSYSSIGVTDDVFVETKQMNKVLAMGRARKARLKAGRRAEPMAEYEVGRTIVDISTDLEDKGRALINQGTYDGQTLWGAVSTSTHGSGLERQPFPDMVLSFVLVGEGGRTMRIEPSNGITEPNGWNEPGIDELIQDNDTFYSAVCSFGSMGIVYSAVITTREFYWLNEWTFVTTWQDFKDSFPTSTDIAEFVQSWDTASFLVSPMIAKSGSKKGVSFKNKNPMSMNLRLKTGERRKIGGTFIDSVAKAFEKMGIITGNAPAEGIGKTVADILPGDAWISKAAIKQTGKRAWMGELLDPNTIADTTPVKRRNKCYKIFPKGGKLFGGYGLELAFPLNRTIEIMDRLIELAEENRADRLFHTAPVAVRFVAPSRAYVSPQYNQETVMFEVLIAKGTKGGPEALERIERAMLDEADVRVHWGLSFDVMDSNNASMGTMYRRWNVFRRIFRRFNTVGTFRNEFTDRIDLS